MKFTNAAVLAASAASAASIKRQADFYSVSAFTASCIPHSTFCNYNFTVVASSAGGKPVVCALTLQGPDTLPEVPLQGCSGGSWYSWSVAKPADGGLNLTVTTELSATTNVTGFYEIPASNLTTTQSGASTSQSYTGPQKLTLPASVVPA